MKKKVISLALATLMVVTNFSALSYADSEVKDIKNYKLKETSDGFTLEYEEEENGKKVYYVEVAKGNVVETKKYIKNNEKPILIEELSTTIKYEDGVDSNLVAEVRNITENTLKTEVVMSESEDENNNIMSRARKKHPRHSNYYYSFGSTGHLGLSALTRGAITFALGTVITGGKFVFGAIAGVVTSVMDGKYRNLYYKVETYYPTGPSKGQPLWKKIVRHYYDKNRTKQCGSSLYYDSDVLCKN